MTKLRRYLKAQGDGATTRLAKAVNVGHSHISRIADGHKRASLKVALDIERATAGAVKARDLNNTLITAKKAKNATRTRERA